MAIDSLGYPNKRNNRHSQAIEGSRREPLMPQLASINCPINCPNIDKTKFLPFPFHLIIALVTTRFLTSSSFLDQMCLSQDLRIIEAGPDEVLIAFEDSAVSCYVKLARLMFSP